MKKKISAIIAMISMVCLLVLGCGSLNLFNQSKKNEVKRLTDDINNFMLESYNYNYKVEVNSKGTVEMNILDSSLTRQTAVIEMSYYLSVLDDMTNICDYINDNYPGYSIRVYLKTYDERYLYGEVVDGDITYNCLSNGLITGTF